MRNLNFELLTLTRVHKEGSRATQEKRRNQLSRIADILYDLGFVKMGARSLKPKHVEAAVQYWTDSGLVSGTLKNYLAAIRWWSRKINKPSVVRRDNISYGIAPRVLVPTEAKPLI